MPFIQTKTTVKISAEQENALRSELGKAIELFSGKTEEWLMLEFAGECRMAFRGTALPDMAMIDVALLGKAKDVDYDRFTGAVCEMVNRILNVPRNRIYVKYSEIDHWGYNGINF
jgi:hypothetical protein